MQSSNIPSKIPLPFAYAAGSSYKNTIPVASQIGITNGRASLADGFPPLNFTPISAGGVPPFGGDMNGILNEMTSIQQWQQAGGFFTYDSAFSTAVGGYPKGAILQSTSLSGLWMSSAENNTSNPDTGGAGWVSLIFEGLITVSMSSSSVTLSQLQSAYPIVVVTGTLTAGSNLIFPSSVGEWIVVNNTTGAFTLTGKTSSGTGVTLTQGASTYIYGDGTNIYFADSAKVASFNGRTGTVTLNATDVTNALGYVPVQPNGTGATGSWNININGNQSGGSVNATSVTSSGLIRGYSRAQIDGTIEVRQNWQSGFIHLYATDVGFGPFISVDSGGSFRLVDSDFAFTLLTVSNSGNLTLPQGLGYQPGGGSWQAASDSRLKENVKPLTNSLSKIKQLNPVTYDWKYNAVNEPTVGFVAQDVKKVLPTAVSEITPNDDQKPFIDDNKLLSFGFKNDIFAYLIGAIQELDAKVEDQAAQILKLSSNK